MRLTKSSPTPTFACACVPCGEQLQSDRDDIYADLDGEPFKAYYCPACASGAQPSLHAQLAAAGVPLDHHESDLYAFVNVASSRIIGPAMLHDGLRGVTVFTSPIDGKAWYDIPFAYEPFWEPR